MDHLVEAGAAMDRALDALRDPSTDDQDEGKDLVDLNTGGPPAEHRPGPSTMPSPSGMTEEENNDEGLTEDDLAVLDNAGLNVTQVPTLTCTSDEESLSSKPRR